MELFRRGLIPLDVKKAILAHEYPRLTLSPNPPYQPEVGTEIPIKTLRSTDGAVSQVSITITGYARGKKGELIAEYSFRDDRPLYLRKGPLAGYTRAGSESIDPEASVDYDDAAQKRYAAQGRLSMAQRKERDQEAKKAQERAARSKLTESLTKLDGSARIEFLAELERLCSGWPKTEEAPV